MSSNESHTQGPPGDEQLNRQLEALEQELDEQEKSQLAEALARSGQPAAQQMSLAARLSRRYLSVGRQALADAHPRKLDSGQRRELSQVLGVDPHDVRIHTGPQAEAAADSFGARAFTVGSRDIYFGRGQFDPSSPEGKALLAHELTHVFEDSLPMAFSLHDDVTASGPPRDDEAHAQRAEEAMYKEARRDKWQDDQEDQMAYGELSVGEKMVLVDKVYKLLKDRNRHYKERIGN